MTETTPIVLLHGVGLDSSMWAEFREELSRQTNRTIVTLDLPGHGTRPPLDRKVSLDDLADDVEGRLPSSAHLIGFSVGALIAQRIARRRPKQTPTLTCISSVWRRNAQEKESVQSRMAAAAQDFPSSVEASLRRWFPPGTAVSQRHITTTREVLLGNDVISYLRVYEVFANADSEVAEELKDLPMPVLAVTGAEDPGSTPTMTRNLAAAVQNGQAHIVHGARHMLPVERPDELTRIIQSFYRDTALDTTIGGTYDATS